MGRIVEGRYCFRALYIIMLRIYYFLNITISKLGIGDDDDDGPSSKRAKSDSPSNMTPTPPGAVGTSGVGVPGMAAGMMTPGVVGSMPRAPFGISG